MRFALKSTLALVVLYLAVLGGFAWWVGQNVRSAVSSLMEDTARLVGGEVAAALTGSALDDLLEADPVTRQRLTQIIADVTRGSNVVASVVVVDQAGLVVVSDEIEIGRQLALPAVVFQDTLHPQFLGPPAPFGGGKFHLFVPLLRDGEAVGYIRLSLSSERIAALYQHARRQLAFAAVFGLSGIVAMGLLLHVQLSRRSAALARTIEATARGEPMPRVSRGDEFALAIEAAGRLGRELSVTRERSEQAQRRVSALAQFMDVGVILLTPDGTPEFVNGAARELLGTAGGGNGHWDTIAALLEDALRQVAGSRQSTRLDLDVAAGDRARRLRVEIHPAADDTHEGFVVLVKDRDILDAFETDLRLASQMRGLARVYGALAHELKAPLSAMALNLEMLSDALQDEGEGGPDLQERRQRYARVLREELARLNRSLLGVLNQTSLVQEQSERFDLRQLVHDLENLLGPQAAQQQVQLDARVPEQDVPVLGHRDRLKQALLNIATNALEAMPDGGQMAVSLEVRNGDAQLAIRDSGPGIPPEVVGKMYGMYFTTKRGGTGIGLYVARSVVESHGGEIQVESGVGTGTCFQLRLPLSRST